MCIYFEDKLYRGNRTVKINSEDFEAFVSPNYQILAEAGVKIKAVPADQPSQHEAAEQAYAADIADGVPTRFVSNICEDAPAIVPHKRAKRYMYARIDPYLVPTVEIEQNCGAD